MREVSPQLRAKVEQIIATQGVGDEPEPEATVSRLLEVMASVDANAEGRGRMLGQVQAYQEVMLERADEEEPFVAQLLAEAERRVEEMFDA